MVESTEMDGLETRLRSWLAAELGAAGVEVDDLRRLSGGSSRENWAFRLVTSDETRPMLLRRDPVASVADTDRAIEVAVIRALTDEAVPAPALVATDLHGAHLDRPSVVMVRSPGRADRAALRARDPLGLGDDGRMALATALADLLADVHSTDTAQLVAAIGPAPADPAATEIRKWDDEIERVRVEAQPELAYVSTWLQEHRPSPPEHPALVHGDYRPANVLVGDDGRISALLDWEFAHLGDPVEDLGWYTTPLYLAEHFIAGRWDRHAFLERYRTRLGRTDSPLDEARLHFWQVLALYKLSAIALAGLASFLDADTDRAAGPIDALLRTTVTATRSRPGASS